MTIARAFLKKEISPVMLSQWEEQQKKVDDKPFKLLMAQPDVREDYSLWVIMVGFYVLSTLEMNPSWVRFIPLALSVLMVLMYLFLWLSSNRNFLKSCEKLRSIIPGAQYLSKSGLEEAAFGHLVHVAKYKELAWRDKDEESLTTCTTRLDTDFKVLKLFGLTDPNGYGVYFKEAEAQLGTEVTVR